MPEERTALHGLHTELGARFTPFAGYEMPVQYPTGITAEHHAVRKAAGLFDVSHMGEVETTGPDAEAFLQRLLSNDVIPRHEFTSFSVGLGGTQDEFRGVFPSFAALGRRAMRRR